MKSLLLVLLLSLCSFDSKAAFSFSDGFESGSTSGWDATVPRPVIKGPCSSTLNVIDQTPMPKPRPMSDVYFLEATICDAAPGPVALVEDDSPNDESSFRAMFDFNPNTANIALNGEIVIFRALSFTPNLPVVDISLFNNMGNLEIRAYGYNDAGSRAGSISFQLPDLNTHRIGIGWSASSGPGSNDGVLELELDQIPAMSSISNLDNDTLSVDFVHLGNISSANNSGTIWFDQYDSDDESLPVSLMSFDVE